MALSICGTITDLHDQELVKHGDSSFPIACYADNLSIQNVAWHWHEEWEFVIVYKGEAEFFLENQHIIINEGDGIFINGKALHAVKKNKDHQAILHSAVFHPRLIGGNVDSIFWQSLVQPLLNNSSISFIVMYANISWQNEVLNHFSLAWENIAYDKDDYANNTRYELSAALRKIINNISSYQFYISNQELINAKRIRIMLEYIEEHYNEDITIEKLAKKISVSASVCLRCFQQKLHTTPIQYIKQLRIKKSAHLLKTTNKSAKEIALQCGFNDISYYTKTFKEIFHQTPREYRKNQAYC